MKDHLKKLQALRNKIDNIDNELLNLLAKRKQTVQKIGRIKHANNLPILNKKRQSEMMHSMVSKAQFLRLSPTFIRKLYDIIREYSIELQKSLNKN